MEKREAEMLEPPLARMLSRLPPGQAEQFSKFVDPMVMLIALGMWGNRIVRIQRAKRGVGISQDEFDRAIGVSQPAPRVDRTNNEHRQQPTTDTVAPEQSTTENRAGAEPPVGPRVDVNPNGVPVAITAQMGDL
jgi:hypothetical protein